MVFQQGYVVQGLLNIYAPNSPTRITVLDRYFENALPLVEHWCVVCDFNRLEDRDDRCGGSIMTIREELACWERLCITVSILDMWSIHTFIKENDSHRFSRSNRRILGFIFQEKIDLVSQIIFRIKGALLKSRQEPLSLIILWLYYI